MWCFPVRASRSLFSALEFWVLRHTEMHFNALPSTSVISSATWFCWVPLNIPLWSSLLFPEGYKRPICTWQLLKHHPTPLSWLNVYFTNQTKSAKGRNAKLGGGVEAETPSSCQHHLTEDPGVLGPLWGTCKCPVITPTRCLRRTGCFAVCNKLCLFLQPR